MISRWVILIAAMACIYLPNTAFSMHSALEEQIEEDLSPISEKSFTNTDLYQYFQELDNKKPCEAVYCRIRNNQFYLTTPKSRYDQIRIDTINYFFSNLLKKRSLPDLDFILCTADGFHANSKLPIFVFAADRKCKTNVCLFPDFEALEGLEIEKLLKYSQRYPWREKIDKMFFRGSPTGNFEPSAPYFGNVRVRAVMFSAEHPNLLEADLISIHQPEMRSFLEQHRKAAMPILPIEKHFVYKYLLDIDGHSTTYARCRWILVSNSVLLKVSSDFTQWYYKALAPYENYIPIHQDLSDLEEVFTWLSTHDEDAYSIAMKGQQLGKEIFSDDSVELYVYKLLLAYSEKMILNPDNDSVFLKTDERVLYNNYRKCRFIVRKLWRYINPVYSK